MSLNNNKADCLPIDSGERELLKLIHTSYLDPLACFCFAQKKQIYEMNQMETRIVGCKQRENQTVCVCVHARVLNVPYVFLVFGDSTTETICTE